MTPTDTATQTIPGQYGPTVAADQACPTCGRMDCAHLIRILFADEPDLAEVARRIDTSEAVVENNRRVRNRTLDEVEAARLVCPMHNQTDCSPLLNGCSVPRYMHAGVAQAVAAARRTDTPPEAQAQ